MINKIISLLQQIQKQNPNATILFGDVNKNTVDLSGTQALNMRDMFCLDGEVSWCSGDIAVFHLNPFFKHVIKQLELDPEAESNFCKSVINNLVIEEETVKKLLEELKKDEK